MHDRIVDEAATIGCGTRRGNLSIAPALVERAIGYCRSGLTGGIISNRNSMPGEMVKHSEPIKGKTPDAAGADDAQVSHTESERATHVEATPSMAQYLEIKAANPDSLLWYRMGDFYELFFEDAVAASEALAIVLTKRGRHLGEAIPMCGVPIHRADEYLQRLIRKGFRVAVCEQLEDPAEARKRGAKAVVKRDVVRLVTPGTLTEETLLDARATILTALFARRRATARSSDAERASHSRRSTSRRARCEIGDVAARRSRQANSCAFRLPK